MGVRHAVRRIGFVIVAGALVVAPSGAGAAVRAAVDPSLNVHSVTLSRASVAVSGLNVVTVQVQVSAGYTASVSDVPLSVILARTAPGGTLRQLVALNLPRVSGTAASGVWSGPLYVPSTAAGAFTVTGVLAGFESPSSPVMSDPTPYAGPTLAVTGLHQPRITATTYPNPVPIGSSYSIGGTVIDTATNLPYVTRVPVEIGVDNRCVEYGGAVTRTTTAGTFASPLPASAAASVNCAQVKNNGTFIEGVSVLVRRPGEIGARPSATSGRVGTSVPVYGTAKNAALCPVELQFLRGSTQWRRASLARVRESGRFTLLAPLTTAGTPIFRAYLPICRNHVDARTSAFAIKAV